MTGTRVFVARVGRQTKTREYKDLEAHFTAHLGYSHHQKAVIVDAPIEQDHCCSDYGLGGQKTQVDQDEKSHPINGSVKNGKEQTTQKSNLGSKRIIAFVGGIDLTGT